MCELLASGSRLCGSGARCTEVGELICGLCMLVFEVLCDGTCRRNKSQQQSNAEIADKLWNHTVGHILGDGMVLDSVGRRGCI